MRVSRTVETADESYAEVRVQGNAGEAVALSVTDRDGDYAYVDLTGDEARELAVRLAQAAILADEIPAHIIRDMA